MENNVSIWYASIPEWLSAIGTISAVLIALFQKSIRQWWNKPNIKVTCNKNNPCVEEIKEDTQSSSVSKEIRLRVKLENTGNYIANNCLMIIDSYYAKREDGAYVITEFTPKQMKDYRGANISYVAPHLNYYYDILTIHQFDEIGNVSDAGHQKQFFKPSIIGDGKAINLKKGTYIIPLKFYSSKLPTVTTYLKLFWNSDDCTTDSRYFDYNIISEKEFKAIKKS